MCTSYFLFLKMMLEDVLYIIFQNEVFTPSAGAKTSLFTNNNIINSHMSIEGEGNSDSWRPPKGEYMEGSHMLSGLKLNPQSLSSLSVFRKQAPAQYKVNIGNPSCVAASHGVELMFTGRPNSKGSPRLKP